ncbi:hypothetical protein [Lacrimispora algidixylanolytica]|uniref:hypothetical protein n=1 Tax=Lacrimispora algidixylanolytica TaxID=94868 RepID=UPI0026C49661
MKYRNSLKEVLGNFLSLALFPCMIVAFIMGILLFSQKADTKGADTLQDALRRASVQCYAIEGRYPPSLEYLAQHYGIQIDKERYDVFYSGFASNFMPDITVNLHEESPGGGK